MNDIELHELPGLLDHIIADDRDLWVKIGMGLKAEFDEAAFDAYDNWSQTGNGYSAADCKTAWRGFKGRAIGIGTVIHYAKEGGWVPKKTELTKEEKRARLAESEARRISRQAKVEADEEKRAFMQAAISTGCTELFEKHCDTHGDSQYLNTKAVTGDGLRYVNKLSMLSIDDRAQRVQVMFGSAAQQWLSAMSKPSPDHLSVFVLRPGDVVIPLRDAQGKLWALQQIKPSGKKLFPKYGRKSGCYSLIGDMAGASVLAVAEGFATAATVHAATGWPTVVAIDSGNLGKVCAALVEQFPDMQLLVAGDDDPETPGNPGRTAATNAAEQYGGIAVFPTGGKPKDDWNDLQIGLGDKVVTEQLLAGLELGQLPRAPSLNGAASEIAAPAPLGGEGDEETRIAARNQRILGRFALVEGKTDVWDSHKVTVMRKSAFEAMVGKDLAKTWMDNIRKKLIDKDQAQMLTDRRKMQGKAMRDGWGGMSPIERYVYIDGTKDIWDRSKRRRVPEGAVKMMLGDAYPMWLNSPERVVVDMDHIVFDPTMTKDPAVYINTFEGLPLAPIENDAACAAMRELISFLCNGDPDAAHWLTCWLAYPLQNMGSKMDTAVLLHSSMEGSGKSLFFSDIMGAVYGQYGATVGQAQLESSWTVWQSGKMYAVFEEVVSRDQRYNQVGKIKHMITGKTVRMESKFVNGWEESNHMNAVFLSNEILPWPISENDRRMLVMWPEKTLPVDRQKALGAELAGDGVEALLGYLMNYECGDFNERTRPPFTDARQRLVELSRAGWENFISQWRQSHLTVPYGIVRTQDLHDLYLEWCQVNKENTLSETKFSLFVSTLIPKTATPISWRDDSGVRRRSFMFVPETITELPRFEDSKVMGDFVREWRRAAYWAGWSVDHWAKAIGFVVPMAADRPKEAA